MNIIQLEEKPNKNNNFDLILNKQFGKRMQKMNYECLNVGEGY